MSRPFVSIGSQMERARRFERPTLTLARLCSTPELRPHPWVSREITPLLRGCKRKSCCHAKKFAFQSTAFRDQRQGWPCGDGRKSNLCMGLAYPSGTDAKPCRGGPERALESVKNVSKRLIFQCKTAPRIRAICPNSLQMRHKLASFSGYFFTRRSTDWPVLWMRGRPV